jgi:enoyl-CoA hydratase
VIAAVNGIALGGGFTLVQESDIIIASRTATFGLPEVNIGLAGGLAATKRGMNVYQARKLYFTGRTVDAAYLEQRGVIDQVVEPEELMPAAWDLASEIASKSPVAMRTAKWIANEAEKLVDYEQVNRVIQARATVALAGTADQKEAVEAFREKRPGVFTGR